MKKIMFNDRYGLTQAVLEGRKTMTRRIVKGVLLGHVQNGMPGMAVVGAPYKVGEVVAVAQAYKDAFGCPDALSDGLAGWNNKMFVKAGNMPHKIRITNVRIEGLQDISDEDCLREGIVADKCKTHFNGYAYDWCYDQDGDILASCWYKTPREAFAALIDKVSGKGTWASNPWVFVYEFEWV